ncbi:hypothetical protein ABIB60_000579 [Hymenobacter sp. UYP22]
MLYAVSVSATTDSSAGWGQFLEYSRLAVAIAQIPLRILSIVFFLQWFRRAYYNLRYLSGRPDHTDGWAVGAWFVPFLNLFRPYSIMKEIWYGTNSAAGRGRQHGLLQWWWIAYLVHGGLNRAADKVSTKAETLTELQNAATLNVFSNFADVVSAALTLMVIRYVHESEQAVALFGQVRQLGGDAPAPDDVRPTEEEQYA